MKEGEKGWRELSKHLTVDDIEMAVNRNFQLKGMGIAIESTAKRDKRPIHIVAYEYYKIYFKGKA